MADSKVSQLSTIGTLDVNDLLYVVDDPSGTPASRKTTVGAVIALGHYVQLAQIVTSGSQSTVNFTSISGSYNTLKVICTSRDTQAGTSLVTLRLMVNNDSTSGNYTSTQRIGGQNGAAFASTGAASSKGVFIGVNPQDGNTAGLASQCEVTIANYAGTTWQKNIISVFGSVDGTLNGTVATYSSIWKSTSAITSLTFGTDGTAFKDGSIFTLYGI